MKKCLIGVLLVVLIVLASFNSLSVLALKPKQHIGLGNGVLKDLEEMNGWLLIDGNQYEACPLVYEAIKRFPSYYKMGLIGPDGFPDIVFGQGIIHPDSVGDADHYWGDGKSWSNDWLEALLSHVASDYDAYASNYINTYHNGYVPSPFEDDLCLKELAFTYGYITHAAGDMFGHTWVNRYVGGPWEWNDNAIRHVIVEAYLGQKMATLFYPTYGGGTSYGINYDRIFTGDNVAQDEARDNFAEDDDFQQFLFNTFYRGPAADALVSGGGMRTLTFRLINLFVGLEDSINGWLAEFDKDIVDRAWWAWPPHGYIVEGFLELWKLKIEEFFSYWMNLQSKIAYEMFAENIFDGLSTIKNAVTDLSTDGFIYKCASAILPPNPLDLVGLVGDVTSFFTDLLWEKSGLKHLWLEMLDWIKEQAIDILNDIVKGAFGVTLDELQTIITDALTGEAFSPSWPLKLIANNLPLDIDPHWERAPFGYNTKQMIDDELAYATPPPDYLGIFPEKFSVTYNIITIGKMILLPGPELNRLLADHGYSPNGANWYDGGFGCTYSSLLDPGMCVMLGFIKSLDGSYQWMPVAPTSGKLTSDGKSYGLGMPLWQDVAARERVFKKIFHVGPQVIISPLKCTLRPGQIATFTVHIFNYENQMDTIDVNVYAQGDGSGGFTGPEPVPRRFPVTANPSYGTWFQVQYVYNGPKSFVDAKLCVSATASAQAVARTLDSLQILSNYEEATIMVFAPGAEQRQIDPGQPCYVKYLDVTNPSGEPISWAEECDYVTSETPLNLYYVVNSTFKPSYFNYSFVGYRTLESAPYSDYFSEDFRIDGQYDGIAAVRGVKPFFMVDPSPSSPSHDGKLNDGQYGVISTTYFHFSWGWYFLSSKGWGTTVDNTPPSTTLDLDQVWYPYRIPPFFWSLKRLFRSCIHHV